MKPHWRGALAGALALPLLASCGGGGCDGWSCNPPPPTEVQYGLVTADLNGDGLPDVVNSTTLYGGAAGEAGRLDVYLHPVSASGSFGAPTSYAAGRDPWFLASTDLDGDGLPDVVAASVDDGALLLFPGDATAPGTLKAPVQLASPGASQLAIADVNGDGLPDLVAADYNVSLFLQNPAAPGTFFAPLGLYSGGANWVAVGDLNGDGLADIAVTDATGVKLLLHTGAASSTTFQAPVSVYQPTANLNVAGADAVAIADVNGDGLADLVITDPGPTGGAQPFVAVLLQDAANHGQFLAAVDYPTAAHSLGQDVVVADLNGDGLPDIVVGGSRDVSVLLQDPAHPGSFLAAQDYATPLGTYQLSVADLDGDGHPDIVVTNGATTPTVNGVITAHAGVLYQDAANPGSFKALQDLP